ncbi:MAG TPA: T9SS type A sorting domain-containing protein [Candidatus Kapabacteria bacterium]|nr:T9SS type A sorting domain-containing protein [Candidatus Kapabacteria bacterium]
MSVLWTVVVLIVLGATAFGQQVQSVDEGLFVRSTTPVSNNGAPFPSAAGFFTINQNMLISAARFEPPIYRVTNFPLGSTLVNLAVSQFDVLTRDAKISARTAAGDVPIKLPPYVLLRGEVENMPGSHVYIAVFPSYALGYIEVPLAGGTTERYLIQPVNQSMSEGTPSMICYHQDAIDLTNDTYSKWTCGTEDFAGNFKNLHTLESDISKRVSPKQNPLVQSKTVRMMKIDLECDYDYFLDFQTRYPSASADSQASMGLQYAVATLAASSDIYVRDLSGAQVASYLHIWTVTDPWPRTTTQEMLGPFSDYGSSSLADDGRAGAILLSGVNSIGGLAWLGTICQEALGGGGEGGYCVCGTDNVYSYPKDGFIWDVDVVAHEFGHIVGALHTHNCSWNPAIDSCVAAEGGSCYSTPVPTLGTIMSYCHLTTKGVALKFHQRQIPDMTQWIDQSSCSIPEQLPLANAGQDQFMCGSDSAIISGSGTSGNPPYSYSWRALPNTPVSTNPTFTVKPFKTTSYVLTLTDANSLRTYDTMVVVVDNVKANPGLGQVICGPGTVPLSGSSTGGAGVLPSSYKYKWTDKSTGTVVSTQQSFSPAVNQTTTYTLKVTDSVGCSNSADIVVTVTTKPQALLTPAGASTICDGDTVTFDAGAGFKHYIWYRDGKKLLDTSVQFFHTMTAGVYTVVVTNPGIGCWDSSAATTVTVDSKPLVPTISKQGATLTSSTDQSYIAYQWFKNQKPIPGATNSTYNATTIGAYYVQVTGTNGCKSRSTSVQITSGVPSAELDEHIGVYPNPATSQIVFEWNDVTAHSLSLMITDLSGKMLYNSISNTVASSGAFSIDVHSLAGGTYFLHYNFDGTESVRKFVKQ